MINNIRNGVERESEEKMLFDSRKRIRYKSNTEALHRFGCFGNLVRPHYERYPGHEKEFVVWFNYRCYYDEDLQRYVNPSPTGNEYINLYSDNDNTIEQIIPDNKDIDSNDRILLRIVFVKENDGGAYFSGVYILTKIIDHHEFFERISYTFDTENLYTISPTNRYNNLIKNEATVGGIKKLQTVEDIVREKNTLKEIPEDILNQENEETLDDVLNYELNHTEIDDLNLNPNYKPVIEKDSRFVSSYKRNRQVAINALRRAQSQCEFDKRHHLFDKINGGKYLEVHHIIPMCAQDDFEVPLDRDENVVCLCPSCHREIHFGRKRKDIIEFFYEQRRIKLEEAGINTNLEEILTYYH